MCGITGKVYFIKREIREAEISLMIAKLVHRGPDDSGAYISKDKRVGFGSARLAIIDLSKKGHQPMSYLNRYVITFNGEIYNFREEREKLKKEGYRFSSNSDTEVILALYVKYGKKCLNYLRGMFAFAIFDEHEKTIFLARDRIGKKPLKYYLDENMLVFASELKAILTQADIAKKIDYQALQQYLIYGYAPAPATGFAGINKLEPGSYLFINLSNRSIEKKRYWQPLFNHKLHLSEKEWCERILNTLEESTKLRMIADVEIGAFLSGGVDSSGVVATMARLSNTPIKTFTITFNDKEWDEKNHAQRIAKLYNTDHHELLAKPESIDILPFLAYQYEEPFADAGCVISYMVSKLASKDIKVVLNGDGGDELFAGYPNRYFRLKRDVDYNSWINTARPLAAMTLKKLSRVSKNKTVLRAQNFFQKSRLPLYERFASYNQLFSYEELQKHSKGRLLEINSKHSPYEPVQQCFEVFKGRDLKDAGMKFDLLYWLPDDLLAKVDIASMAASLEARSPLLDHKMIELSCQMPFNLKVKGGETKYIFKKALESIVPKANLYRPKRGFGLPLGNWFKGKLNKYAAEVLLSKKSMTKELVEAEYMKEIILSRNQAEDFGPRIWALLMMELWLNSYF